MTFEVATVSTFRFLTTGASHRGISPSLLESESESFSVGDSGRRTGGGTRGCDRTEPARVVVWGSSAVVTVITTLPPACGAVLAGTSLSVVEGPVRAADAALGVRVIAAAAVPGVDDQR